MEDNLVIVVPYYKETLNELEKISISQMLKVLPNYKKCFLMPEHITKVDFEADTSCEIKKCPDKCFANVISYSKWLLSAEFYKAFSSYEYMLIHQLDVFIFKDDLSEFCSLGYDYIGAPWFSSSIMYKYAKSLVGNGGLSLRNITSTIKILENNKKIVEEKFIPYLNIIGEDVVFSWFGTQKQFEFRVAPVDVAKRFSLECDFQKAYNHLNEKLPFGCHHWWNGDYGIWREHVRAQGYVLKDEYTYTKHNESNNIRLSEISRYLLSRILRYGNRDRTKKILLDSFHFDKPISIWGLGIIGKRCLSLFDFINIPIKYIIDRRAQKDSVENNIPVILPNSTELKKRRQIIIISTRVYYDEIAGDLKKLGLEENVDFFSYSKIERDVVFKNYEPLWKCMVSK